MERHVLDLDGISPRRQAFNGFVENAVEKLAGMVVGHWLALVNLATFLFIFFSGVAPFLMSVGLTLPAQGLYLFYKVFCHDLPERHYFIFGYRMTLDHRSLAIYAAMLAVGLIFPFVRSRLKPLNWRFYVLLALPMAIDGFSQMFGFRQSNWELRTITGALFGIGTAWLLYPYVETGMRDARDGLRRNQEAAAGRKYGAPLAAEETIKSDGRPGR